MAVNWLVAPAMTLGDGGVTAIDFTVAAVTVSVTGVEVTPPKLAVIADVPVATPVARPAGLIIAVDVVAEVQLTVLVMTVMVPLL